jgi:hypothetical protein
MPMDEQTKAVRALLGSYPADMSRLAGGAPVPRGLQW